MLKALLVHKGEVFGNVDITAKVAFSKKKKKNTSILLAFFLLGYNTFVTKRVQKREPMLY